jgi:hypothetical protein
MQPRIPRDAWCVFGPIADDRLVGRILLVEHRGLVDPDTGSSGVVASPHSTAATSRASSRSRRTKSSGRSPSFLPFSVRLTRGAQLRLEHECTKRSASWPSTRCIARSPRARCVRGSAHSSAAHATERDARVTASSRRSVPRGWTRLRL